MAKQPPKLPLRFFRFFCSEGRIEELEGDLFEVFQEFIEEKGTRFSSLFYWWIVIRSFRSYALKRTTMKNKGLLSSWLMFLGHNLKVARRNLWKNRATSIINIIGLAIGISGFLAIYSITKYELSFDNHIPERDRIYRVFTEFKGAFKGTNRGGSKALAFYLRDNFSQLEEVAFFYNWSAKPEILDDEKKKVFDSNSDIIITDSSYFNVIDQYEWLAGSHKSSLSEPNRVVLLRNQAEKYFGVESVANYIGKKITYQDSLDVYVSGIVENTAFNTDFIFTDFISNATIGSSWLKERYDQEDWTSIDSGTQTFLKLKKGAPESVLDSVLSKTNKKASTYSDDPAWVTYYSSQPFSDLHFNTALNLFDNRYAAAHMPSLKIMIGVSLALLVIAIFNFINLETAQAANKSKEVGLRKVLGSSRNLLMGRFLTESTLIAILAIIISIPLTYWGLSFFEEFIPSGMKLQLTDFSFWVFVVSVVAMVSLLAGTYPAFIVSSFSPITALKSKLFSSTKGQKGALVRKLLISFQFIFSQVLIVATVAILSQISFMLDKDLGFKEDGIALVRTPSYYPLEKQQVFINELSEIPFISHISVQRLPPASQGWASSTMKFMKDTAEISFSANRKWGDENYISLYGLEIIAGRNYRKNEAVFETLINETCMKLLGVNDPMDALGLVMKNGDRKYEVVGVVKDFHFMSLRTEVKPLMINYSEDNYRTIGMKIATGDIHASVNEISERWETIYPDDPMEVNFFDETIQQFYITERKTSKLAATSTGIAILISCLGLFGLISFVITQRSKEVGVRKVLGASSFQISSIISREFLFLIGVSFLIATPISYFYIADWMNGFAYRVSTPWWIYAIGGVASVFIALVTVGTKVWRAASTNPIDSLRYE